MSLCAIIPASQMQAANDALEQAGYGGGNLTQERLKELFMYHPETGHFTLKKIQAGSRKKVGEVMGYLRTDGYVAIKIRLNGKTVAYKAHRLAYLYMTGEFPSDSTDHINGIKNDNRWENIRAVNRSENMWNRKINTNNPSGFKGVIPYKGNFKALLRTHDKLCSLGIYKTSREAAIVVGLERLEQHGIHARFE